MSDLNNEEFDILLQIENEEIFCSMLENEIYKRKPFYRFYSDSYNKQNNDDLGHNPLIFEQLKKRRLLRKVKKIRRKQRAREFRINKNYKK
jgi:hypothetical protein